MTNEDVYDTEIAPLMTQIIDICDRHKIALLADFLLDADGGLRCTTALLEDEFGPAPEMVEALQCLRPRPRLMPTPATPGTDGKVTRIDRIACPPPTRSSETSETMNYEDYDRVRAERDEWRSMALRLGRHVNNPDNMPATRWSIVGLDMLAELRAMDRIAYDRAVKAEATPDERSETR